MPTFAQDLETIKSLRQKQTELNKSAGADTTYAATFGDKVWDRIRSARADRGVSMMQEGVGTTMGQLETDPALMRERMGADVNPLTVDALTARARAQNLNTLGTLSQFEADTTGTLEGAIGAQTNQLIAKAAAKKAEADAAKSEADTLIEQIQLQMEQEKHRLSMTGKGETYEYTLPNGQVLRGLSAKEYSDLYEKYEGGQKVELKGALATDMNFNKNIYKAAVEAEAAVKPEYTGLFDYLKGSFRGLTGKQQEGEVGFRFNKDAYNTALRNKISGAAVSTEEKKAMEGMLINPLDSDKTVMDKITRAKRSALLGAGSILSTSGYEKVDPEEYMMRDIQIKQGARPPLSSFDK